MLERAALLLSTAEPHEAGGTVRRVVDPTTGELLGHAYGRRPRSLLAPRVGWVTEAPDDSLLLVCRRSQWFGLGWVFDADDVRVARLRGRSILAPNGVRLARRFGNATAGRLAAASTPDLVSWNVDGGGTLVRFANELEDEPLIKMGLLAAILET